MFPLTGVMLLPGTVLPLHIFEPRYRNMIEDALGSDKIFGMIQPFAPQDDNRGPQPDAGTAAPDGDVVVDASVNGVVRVRFASDADASTLQSLLAPDVAGALYDPAYQPLPFSLARAVLAKIGGRLDLGAAGDGGTALDVHLPVPDRPA